MKTAARGAIGAAGLTIALWGVMAMVGNPFSGPFGGPASARGATVLTGTGALAFPGTAEQVTVTDTLAVTGALTTDAVVCGPTDSTLTDAPGVGIAFAYVSTAGTVTVGVLNTSAVPVDVPSATWRCSVVRP